MWVLLETDVFQNIRVVLYLHKVSSNQKVLCPQDLSRGRSQMAGMAIFTKPFLFPVESPGMTPTLQLKQGTTAGISLQLPLQKKMLLCSTWSVRIVIFGIVV